MNSLLNYPTIKKMFFCLFPQKCFVFEQNVINILKATRMDLQCLFYTKILQLPALIHKIVNNYEQKHFFNKKESLKNGYSYDYKTFTNEFLVENCIKIRNQLKRDFFPVKHQFLYGVWKGFDEIQFLYLSLFFFQPEVDVNPGRFPGRICLRNPRQTVQRRLWITEWVFLFTFKKGDLLKQTLFRIGCYGWHASADSTASFDICLKSNAAADPAQGVFSVPDVTQFIQTGIWFVVRRQSGRRFVHRRLDVVVIHFTIRCLKYTFLNSYSRKNCLLQHTSSPADKISGRFWRRIKNPETSDTIKWLK